MRAIRDVCVRIASQNPGWGYSQIQGAVSSGTYGTSLMNSHRIITLSAIIKASATD